VDQAVGQELGPWFVMVRGSGGVTLPIPAAGGEAKLEKGRYVIAYANDGNPLWLRTLPETTLAASAAPDGSLWVAGDIARGANAEIPEKSLSLSAGQNPLSYFMHYSKDGTLMKVVVVRGAGHATLAVLSDGSLAIAGTFSDSVRIGEGESWEFAVDKPKLSFGVFLARCFP
jgi:hypothetical protein